MTLLEARDLLLSRIGFTNDYNSDVTLVPDVDNLQSDSGRFFQEEFTWLRLEDISLTMDKAPNNVEDFNVHLDRLRKSVIMMVLSDVFFDGISEDLDITLCLDSFDNAIMKRMAIVVADQVLTTKRKNYVERVDKDWLAKLFFELEGNSKDSLSEYNIDLPTSIGIKSRYGAEIIRLRDKFDTGRMLNNTTIGLGRKDELYNRDNIIVWN